MCYSNSNDSYYFRSDLLSILAFGIMEAIIVLHGISIDGINTLDLMDGSAALIKTVPG
jgi:hypothetical protein